MEENTLENASVYNRGLGVLRDYEEKILTVRIIVPTLNEEKNIQLLLKELIELGYCDVIVIDGKSVDNTVKIARCYGAKAVIQKGNGKGAAVREALTNYCEGVDAVIMMDADGSMDPKEIPRFIERLDWGADVVKGSRFLSGGYTHDMTLLRKIGNAIFTKTFNLLFSTRYSDLCYGYIGFSRYSIEILGDLLKSNGFEIETEILIQAEKEGLNVSEVPSTEFLRKNGDSNLRTFKDGRRILRTLIEGIFS